MPGRKSEVYDGSYITQERAYRTTIVGVDASVELDSVGDSIPTINLDLDMEEEIRDPGRNAAPVYTQSAHGPDAVLGIFVVHSALAGGATLQLWRRLDDTDGIIPRTWCLVSTTATVGNVVIRADNLIAGKYRVIVSVLAGGTLSLAVAQTL